MTAGPGRDAKSSRIAYLGPRDNKHSSACNCIASERSLPFCFLSFIVVLGVEGTGTTHKGKRSIGFTQKPKERRVRMDCSLNERLETFDSPLTETGIGNSLFVLSSGLVMGLLTPS
jgi:hypothetical protein